MSLEAFFSHVASWLSGTLTRVRRQRSIGYVDDVTAQQRASLCRLCEKQKNFVKDCPSCRASIEGTRRLLIKGRPDRGDGLLGCSVLNEDTRVSILLNYNKVRDPRLPPHCWRKKQ